MESQPFVYQSVFFCSMEREEHWFNTNSERDMGKAGVLGNSWGIQEQTLRGNMAQLCC